MENLKEKLVSRIQEDKDVLIEFLSHFLQNYLSR